MEKLSNSVQQTYDKIEEHIRKEKAKLTLSKNVVNIPCEINQSAKE